MRETSHSSKHTKAKLRRNRPRRKSVSEVAAAGERLYRRLAPEYAREQGKYLAIDVGTGKAYLAASPQDALKLAENVNPKGSFHLVKIGSDGLYRVASYGQRLTR
jgi:hypothetical protein